MVFIFLIACCCFFLDNKCRTLIGVINSATNQPQAFVIIAPSVGREDRYVNTRCSSFAYMQMAIVCCGVCFGIKIFIVDATLTALVYEEFNYRFKARCRVINGSVLGTRNRAVAICCLHTHFHEWDINEHTLWIRFKEIKQYST